VTYKEKLRDPRWQRLRLEIMQRDQFKCCCCGDSSETLNVHHLKYSANPWDTHPDDLETLCHLCHDARSSMEKKIRAIPTSFWRDFISKPACAAMLALQRRSDQ